MTNRRLNVVVQDAAKCPETPAPASLRKWARAVFGREARGELTIRIVDETESAALNSRFRGKSGPANVLAFPASLGDGSVPRAADAPLGDLVVCAPVVLREAVDQGKQAEGHWAHMVVHGALHLVGYDHETEEQARVMEDRERELLARLGFGDPYA